MRGYASLDSFGTILAGLANRLGIESKLFEARLRREWAELVGKNIAQHTRPDQIRFKKLYIHVHNSVWLQQLTFLKPVLLTKVNELAGQQLVGEVVLRIGQIVPEDAVFASPADPVMPPCRPDPEILAEAARHSAGIQDPDLREQLAAVMAQALSPPGFPRRF
ncbi:MAG TPA: DUF721 domain-containing protein [Nitrospiraceae bacterium]|jgi:hypothetical protein|nr:DUF721 domain-containing protein [Nitrospiraceae bacterium]